MYIGSRKIKKTEIKGDETFVIFEDKATMSIHTELFDMIKSEKESTGDIMDQIRYALSKRFMAELAYYKLTAFTGQQFATGLTNLIVNTSAIAIGKKFGVTSPDDILLSDILLNS